MIKKITPNQAAEVMGCSPQFIRIGMQRNLLDIGDAIKMSSIWTYNISPGKLAARQGITIEQLNDLIKAMGYKGYIQLAIRSGQYKRLNVVAIKEGELEYFDPLNEDIKVNLMVDDWDKLMVR